MRYSRFEKQAFQTHLRKDDSTMKRAKKDLSQISARANIILNIIFLLYSIACILPLLLILGVSFSSEKSLVDYGYRLIPVHWSLEAYKYVFKSTTSILRAYGITIYATIAGTVLSVLVTTMFAYPLSRKDFKYRNIFAFIVFFTMIFNGGMIADYMIYVSMLHLKNNLIVYLLPFLLVPWNVILMRTFLSSSIPDSLIEAARIDGAGEFLIFNRVVLPLSLPALATIALFTAISIWNDWYTPLLYITDPKMYNLQYTMYMILTNVSFLKSNVSLMGGEALKLLQNLPTQSVRMAMCIISIGPIVFAYPFLQKYFVKGLTVGAVKG